MHIDTLISRYKERRDMLKVTQETVANLSDVSIRTLKQFECGKGNPTVKTLIQLADAVGLELVLEVKQLHTSEES